MALSRREFIKRGLLTVGAATAALGGFVFARNLFARGVPERTGSSVTDTRGLTRYIELERSGELERRERAL
jgi:anaerobic selenocysteine-containing dehydrogenase